MVSDNIFQKVNPRGSDENEKHEHWNHREKFIKDSVKEKAKRYLHNADPFGTFKSIFFVESKALVGAKNIYTYG